MIEPKNLGDLFRSSFKETFKGGLKILNFLLYICKNFVSSLK